VGHDSLSPKDLTHVLNRHHGSLRRPGISPSPRRRPERREGSQSGCDRLALHLLLGTLLFQGFAMIVFDIF
jgi:hypothetical protein